MYYKEDNHFVEATKVRSRVKNLSHEIFLDESISEPEYYRNAISLLRNQVAEGDEVEVYISNGGGLAHTASILTDAMTSSKGKLVGYLSGQICSAATMIALNCDEWVVGEDICFMIHECSYGLGGKGTDIANQQEFMKKWCENTFRRTYTGFLTEEEIVLTLEHGKEHWFDSEETAKRLVTFKEHQSSLQAQAMNQMFDQQIAAEDEALDAGLNHLLTSGKVTQAEVDAIKKITPLLDEAFESGEIDLDNLPKIVETSEEESPDYSNAFTIKVKDEIAAICMYTLDGDGVITEAVLDIAEYDDEVIVSNIWLEDNLERSELITLAKDIGVKSVAHNTKSVKVIIDKIVNHVDCLIEKEENS